MPAGHLQDAACFSAKSSATRNAHNGPRAQKADSLTRKGQDTKARMRRGQDGGGARGS